MAFRGTYNGGEETIFGVFAKNQRGDKVVVKTVAEKNNTKKVDIRENYTDVSNEIKPSPRGVRFSDEMTVDVIVALIKTLEADQLEEIQEAIEAIINN